MNNVTTYYKDQIKERKEKYLKNFINSEYKDIIEKAYDAAVKDVEDVTIERLRNKLTPILTALNILDFSTENADIKIEELETYRRIYTNGASGYVYDLLDYKNC